MLVHREFEMNDGIYVDTKSDADYWIQCGKEYMAIAVDPVDDVRDYIETNIPLTEPIPDENQQYAQAGKILMGVTE